MRFSASSVATIASILALLAQPCHTTTSYQQLFEDPGSAVVSGLHPVSPASHKGFGNSTVSGAAGNSSLAKALEVVAAAQSEAQLRNARLLANPRKNTYALHDGPSRPATRIEDKGTVTNTVEDGTGVNATVAEALALVAEASTKNKTAILSSLTTTPAKRAGGYWMENMVQNGASPYAPGGYKVWRNVKDYGAKGDGHSDDTDAINKAISDGSRCGQDCGSSTVLQAAVYFPAGTYVVSRSIVSYYFTQLIGDATNPPTIKVADSFSGLGVISSDVYIEGGNGASWYINQNNFYRQIRNFVIDMTGGPAKDYIAGLHWQVAQATSLQNIKFKMSTAAGNNQQGIFMENGSGGTMSDLEFIGGSLGAYVGNQQFTVRNLKFSGQSTRALEIHWDWGWTWKGVHIENCPIGVIMWGPDPTVVGSAIFLDSSFSNVGTGLQLSAPTTNGKVTLNLFNVALTNVQTTVQYKDGKTLLGGGSQTIKAWGVGKRYDTNNGEAAGVWQDGAHYTHVPDISSSLLDGSNGFFARSKPQYEGLSASQFINIKSSFGAVGDGKADDTNALNKALQESASSGRILWIPAGVYLVRDTVTFPPGAKVVGQLWSQIMGAGAKFSDINNPYPVVKVGNKGDVGSVEIQDLLFTVKGATAGAIILQWNIHESSPGSAAMWDTHIRVGGAIGSDLQSANCPKLTGKVNKNCIAASMLVHLTDKASAYFENTWFWVADHDLDTPAQTQIDIYVGRGFLIESTGPVWLYGTASEHCVLYQYQTINAANIFMGMIQTESPYYQVAPRAPEPFPVSTFFPSDPSFDFCPADSQSCAFSWGVRILNSANIYLYGAGLYSWFNQYGQDCVKAENCQDRIFYIEDSSSIWIYSLITKAAVEMISPVGGLSVIGKDNKVNYCDIVMAWLGNAGSNGNSNAIHRSPASATVIPFPAETVKPTETFTLAGPVVSQVDYTHNDGNQNIPPGPGESKCLKCDLSRLITSTCCGIGGGVSNPLEIGAGVALPRPLFLPPRFVPNQQVTGADGNTYPAGQPLPREVLVPIGTIFPVPFIIPAGLPLSDTWSDDRDGNGNGTLFLPGDFWRGQHTVTCSYPCTIIFPPLTTTTTWSPPPITYETDSTTTTTPIPPFTTELIKISRTTVPGTKPTQTIRPKPGKKPLCLKLPLIGVKLCPPDLFPFPPPVPDVTIIPVPPGGKPGPTTPDNKPTEEEQQEEEEDEDEDKTCPLDLSDPGDGEDGGGDSYPGAGKDNQPPNYTPPGAGTGNPTKVTVTVTETDTVSVTQDITTTVVVTPNPYPYTWDNPYETNTIICESSTITHYAGYRVTQCAGKRSTIYAHGTPDPEPSPTEDPKPEPTNGWYTCDEGASGPYDSPCMGGRSTCTAPPLEKCPALCDKVVKGCAKGSKFESILGVVGFGTSMSSWGRGQESYYNNRDCPLDHDNCMQFCKEALYGPVQKDPFDSCGAYAYGCDSSRRRIVAVLVVQGACGPKFGRFPPRRRSINATEVEAEEDDFLLMGMSPAVY